MKKGLIIGAIVLVVILVIAGFFIFGGYESSVDSENIDSESGSSGGEAQGAQNKEVYYNKTTLLIDKDIDGFRYRLILIGEVGSQGFRPVLKDQKTDYQTDKELETGKVYFGGYIRPNSNHVSVQVEDYKTEITEGELKYFLDKKSEQDTYSLEEVDGNKIYHLEKFSEIEYESVSGYLWSSSDKLVFITTDPTRDDYSKENELDLAKAYLEVFPSSISTGGNVIKEGEKNEEPNLADSDDYSSKMQEIKEELKAVYDEYGLTSRYLNNKTITPEQGLENYELRIQQFTDIQEEVRLITPPNDMQESHQSYLDALDLFIESCNLFIREIEEEDATIGYDAAVIHNEAVEKLPLDVGRYLVFG